MSAILPGLRKSFSAAKRFGKLSSRLIVIAFCSATALFAAAKTWHKLNTVRPAVAHKAVNLKGKPVTGYKQVRNATHGGAVSLDYGGHDFTFHAGKPAGLTPTSSGVDAPSPGVYGSAVVLGSGITFNQNGVTLDAAGNMYVCDYNGSPNVGVVKKITPDGANTTIIASGFLTQSSNTAIDAAGNVYVVDQGGVWKVPMTAPDTYGPQVLISHDFTQPFDVAVDASDNIYVADAQGGLFKMANDGSGKVRIDNNVTSATAVKVDSFGNVYVTDLNTGSLYRITPGGTETVLANGFGLPRALAIDGMGNAYVCDESAGSIFEVASGGGAAVPVLSGLPNNVGLAVDATYSLYIGLQPSSGVNKYSPVGGYFISEPLPAGLNFDNTTGAILGRPQAVTAQKAYIISAYNSDGGVSDTLRLSVATPGPAPVVSYSNPNVATLGSNVTITPSATGVDAPGYASAVPIANNLSNPGGVATDVSGNIYVAESANNTIAKIPADGSPTITLGTGFSSPTGIAVDPSGNIYVADRGSGTVIKMSADGLSTSAIGTGFGSPTGVALDAAGNVYVADQGLEAVFKILVSDGSTVQLADNFSLLTGIAVDKTGQNIYVSDGPAQSVYKVGLTCGCATDLGATFAFPFSIALDPAGNLLVADFDFFDSTTAIYKGDGRSSNFVNTGINFSAPSGMATDAAANLFVADAATNIVYEVSPSGGYFLTDALPKGLTFNDTTGVISGIPAKVATAADYHFLAYNANNFSSTIINLAVVAPPPPVISYTNPNVDTIGATITPIAPAPANTSAPAYADHETVTNGFAGPLAPASDAAGNIYVLDRTNDLVKKIPADGSAPIAVATGFTFGNLTALAVDVAGNVYVADQGNHAIEKIAPDGVTVTTVGSSFTFPVAVAVDDNNNVYVGDLADGAVYKVLASDGSTATLSGTFDFLTGIAVDKTGQNIYVSDGAANSVYKVSPTCGCPEDLGFNFVHPSGVALDPQGNLYVTDTDASNSTGTLYLGDGQSANFLAVSSPFADPQGVAVDPSGNLFVADAGTGTLEKIIRTGGYFLAAPLPKGLSLNDTTGVITGKPKLLSAATDYKVIAYNFGGGTQALVNIAIVPPPPPTLSYTTPNSYPAGVAITTLQPTSTNVARPDYAITPVTIGTGFNSPRATAVDKSGNVFVADSLNNRVMMIAADGSGAVPWGFGFSGPNGVAVDSLGYVYVSDYGNQLIKMISPNGVTVTQMASVLAPTALAVDASRNVYYTDQSNGLVYKIDVSTGTPAPLNDSFALLHPTAVATDGQHVYVSDGYMGLVMKITTGNPIPDLIGPFTNPTGLAVDGAGTLYISDEDDNVIYRLSLNGHTPGKLSTTGFGGPNGISVDGKGNLYVADVVNDLVAKVAPAGGYYIDKALPAGLSFSSRSGKISGTPAVGSPATDYTATAYNQGAAVSGKFSIEVTVPPAPTISYTGPNIYFKDSPISTLTPSITDNRPVFYNTVPAPVSTGFGVITGIATDKTGNVFAADFGANSVVKVPAGGGTPVTISSAFDGPQNVAIDAAGNVYVADAGNGAIKKIPHGTGAPVTVATGFAYPVGVAVDAAGNIYVADEGDDGADNGVVYKVPAGTSTLVNLTGSSPLDPVGVAADAAGNIFFIDSYNGAAYELAGGSGVPVQVGPLLNAPGSITANNAGDIFFSDPLLGTIYVMPAGGGSVITINNMGLPLGLAIDGSGNLYTSTPDPYTGGTLNKAAPAGGLYISPTLPAGLVFDSANGTISGTPTVLSHATNYTINAYNLSGNASGIVNIAVAAPSALLKTLTLNPGAALTKVSGPDYADYTASVSNSTTSVKVKPVTADNSATLTVNGVPSAPGVESSPIILNADTTSIAVTVTSSDGLTKKTYFVTVRRLPSDNARLTVLTLNPGATLTKVSGPNYADYTASVSNSTASVTVKPVTSDPGATLTVNGVSSTPGEESSPITLNADATNITVTVTANDGVTKKTYFVTVTHAPSSNARLTVLTLSPGATLTKVSGPNYADYTASVSNSAVSVKVKPVTSDPGATLTINGASSTPDEESLPVTLKADTTSIAITVTAADGVTKNTYRIVLTRAPSNNARLSVLTLNPGAMLTPVSGPDFADYTATVLNSTASVKVKPVTSDNGASVTVNGTEVVSGAESSPVTLHTDTTSIAVTVTAADGVTKNNYLILITKQAPPSDIMAYEAPKEMPVEPQQVTVHQNVSPNGDGNSDALQIDGITSYPDNRLQIMSRAGNLVYETRGYDNTNKVFDGHSNDGKLQQAGTYFYSLEYKVGNETKRKTGYIVLKY